MVTSATCTCFLSAASDSYPDPPENGCLTMKIALYTYHRHFNIIEQPCATSFVKSVRKQGYGVTCDPCRNATFFPRLRRLFMVFAVFWKYVSQKVTSKLDTLAWRGTFVCISYCYLQCIFVVFIRFSRVCFI